MRFLLSVIITLVFVALFVEQVSASSCAFVTQRVQCGDRACLNHTCLPCRVDDDCYESTFACDAGKCVLKPLKETFNTLTIFGPISGILVCAVAVVAGVGGGGILVPLYVAFLGVPMGVAVGLSQATIVGQSAFNVLLQLQRFHPQHQPPNPTRPNINFEYLALMLPISLVGTLIGSIGNKVSPDWARVVLLFLLLTYVVYRLANRIKEQRAKDQGPKLLEKPKEEEESDDDVTESDQASIQQSKKQPTEIVAHVGKPQYPSGWLLLIIVVFFLQLGSSILKGTKANLVECNSAGFWGIIAAAIVYNTLITYGVRRHLKNLRRQVLLGELDESTVPFKWNKKTTILFPALSVAAGGAASMLGIGGGLVLNFLLLEAGLIPEQASATSGMATFLVALESATNFWLQGELRYDYGLMMFSAGILSTVIGQFVFVKEIKKRGWTFLIIAALAAIMVGSMIALTIFGIWDTYTILHHDGSIGFGSICVKA